ncbi:MAG: toxin-antitoxin system HicB family antitoxin [Pyrinomonadaceae bacterium]
MNKYSFNILWSEEDGEYVATCPAFPGLSALGETEEEALAEAKIALGLFIKTCEERGIPLPSPDVAQEYSGQFRVRLPKSLHRQAARLAAADGISLNQLVISAVEQRVGAKQLGTQMLAEMRQILAEHAARNSLAIASQYRSYGGESEMTLIENTTTTSTRKITMRGMQPATEAGKGN